MKKQQKEYIQSFGCASKTHINSSTDRKKRLELSSNSNKTNLYNLFPMFLKSSSSFSLFLSALGPDMPLESTIVSRYVSSMKKKPSLQGIINHARKHPYKQSVSSSDVSIPKSVSAITHHSSAKKETE